MQATTNAAAAAGSLPNPVPLRQDAEIIGLVGLAHGISHFSQLVLAPLFPWLARDFGVGYAQLGFLLTLFFVVSCAVQAASGFLVDRYGPRPVLFAGLALLGLAGLGYSVATHYWMLALMAVVAGVGNGVFHPVDFTLLNRKVSAPRLGHAYSVHGITGSLGWALAPAFVVPLAVMFSWRVALAAAGLLALAVLALLILKGRRLELAPTAPRAAAPTPAAVPGSPVDTFAFLRIPAVWMCFGFFFFYAVALSVVQAFAPEAARQLHAVPISWVAACLSIYMVCSATGMVWGGFLASDPARCERIIGMGVGTAALVALLVGTTSLPGMLVPFAFGIMGLASGIASPSRDMIVKRSTPEGATGRVYGIVYSGLDIGQAAAPLLFGALVDAGQHRAVWVGLALTQAVLVATAFNVRKVRRTAKLPAPAAA